MWTCIYWLGGSWLMRMPWKWSWISIIKDKENIAIQRRTISAPEHDRPQPNAPSHQFLWEYSIIVQRGRFWSLTIAGKKKCCTYISCHIYPHDKGTCQCLPMKRLCICDTGVLARERRCSLRLPPRDSWERCNGTRDVTMHSYWQDIVTCYPGVISF